MPCYPNTPKKPSSFSYPEAVAFRKSHSLIVLNYSLNLNTLHSNTSASSQLWDCLRVPSSGSISTSCPVWTLSASVTCMLSSADNAFLYTGTAARRIATALARAVSDTAALTRFACY